MSTTHRPRRSSAPMRASLTAAVLALAVTFTPAVADEVTQDDIDRAKSAEQTTAASIASLEASLAQLSVNTAAAEIEAAAANEDYLTAVDELDAATTEAETAQANADAAAEETDEARTDLGAVVAETYEQGSAGTLDVLAPYLSGESLGDATDVSVALVRAGEDTDSQLQSVEALQAVADTMQSIADSKVEAKQTAADAAATAKANADAAATAAQAAQASAETERASLIAQLAEQRNTTVELETAYQEQLEAERKAREEAAAKEAAEQAAREQAAQAEAARQAEERNSQSSSGQSSEESTSSGGQSSSGSSSSGSSGSSSSGSSSGGSSSGGSSSGGSSSGGSSGSSSGSSSQTPRQTATNTSTASSGGAASTAIATAYTYIGVPYVWAGESYAGVDCSGLTMMSYRAAGVYLTHSSRAQYGQGTMIPLSSAQPGDLVFWSSNGTQSGIYHVAMYLGNGQMIEAPTFGYTVRVTSMRYSGVMPYAVRP
ncbi:C40 family peptidase [Actinomyces procaprae]|uniref:C40 family peptidase n=1 Tax=Actinomyces procaprae TaxID=2560010 RepID=UPI001F01F651|nr:C40 family peptidase [Actinomyces procaprae]